MKPLVTILIPNYNESGNIRRNVLTSIILYLKKQTYTWEIVIVDDGSTDGSLELIETFAKKEANIRVIRATHSGKPFALRIGIKAARGQYTLLTDMDQSTPISELSKLLPWTKQGFPVVIGSRGIHRANSSFLRKYVVSLGFLTVRRAILLPEIKDTQCGFKLLETKLALNIFSRMRLFGRINNAVGWKVTAYDVELLHIAKKLGASIKEVSVEWKNTDASLGKSRNFIKESIEMLFEIMRVRANDILGKYNV